MKIKILYEDNNLLVIDKPVGFSVHSDGKATSPSETAGVSSLKKERERTIADWVLEKYPKLKKVGENVVNEEGKILIEKPGIVHRLDKETSGCLIIVKNQEAYENLKKQFQSHTIQKEYVAICVGWPKFDTGIINSPIARSKSDFRKKEIVDKLDNTRGEAREALTRYKVIKKIEYKFDKEIYKFSLIAFFPKTGRMHQIRVHAKSIGHPILGDKLYGNKGIELVFQKKVKRQLLHAKSIEFVNVENNKKQKVESEIPKDFKFLNIA